MEALVFAGLAVVLAIGAVLLWRHANSGARRAASSTFLENQLKRGREASSTPEPIFDSARALRSGLPG
ncbi:MAG: type II secretion protein F, partial [Achromobacter sp.]